MILLAIFFAFVSVLLMIKGSDWSTASISKVARRLGVSHVAVGLIIISMIVSLPEIFVGVSSLLQGMPNIGLGVVIGSVIANIALMVGVCAIIRPLKVQRNQILRDGVFSVIIAIIVLILSVDGEIKSSEGWVFILLFIPYALNVWLTERSASEKVRAEEYREELDEIKLFDRSFLRIKSSVWTFFLGMVVLIFGSYVFTWSLGEIARASNVSDFIVGMTLGAIGTSIPNIASAIQATLKNLDGVAVSETLGSNVFTLLVTLGIIAAFRPISVLPQWLLFDIPVMIIMSVLLFFFMATRQRVSRTDGVVLVMAYVAFLVLNVFIAS